MFKFLYFDSFADKTGKMIVNEHEFRREARNPKLMADIREIRELTEAGQHEEAQQKKAKLPMIFPFGTRKEGLTSGKTGKDLVDKGLFSGHDYDELPAGMAPRQVVNLICKKLGKAGYNWKEHLALVVLSPRHTEEKPRFRVLLKVLEKLRTGDTKKDAGRMERIIDLSEYGIVADPACRPTRARAWYMVDEESILYLNGEVLFGVRQAKKNPLEPSDVEPEPEWFRCGPDGEPFVYHPPLPVKAENVPATSAPAAPARPKVEGLQPLRYSLDGIEDAVPEIIESYLNDCLDEGTHKLEVEGERNDTLFRAACGLRYLDLTAEELAEELMPFTTLDETEVKATVDSAYSQDWEEHGPYRLRRVVCEVKARLAGEAEVELVEGCDGPPQSPRRGEEQNCTALFSPPLGELEGAVEDANTEDGGEDTGFQVEFGFPLPPVLQLVADQIPQRLHPAVLTSGFAGLATFLRETYVINYDGNRLHVGNFINLTLGSHGTGKSFTDRVNRAITRDIEKADAVSRKKINEYKEKRETVPATGKRVAAPKKAYTQIIGDDFTMAGLEQSLEMAYENGPNAPLLWMLSELDLLGKFGVGKPTITSLLRKTFDNDILGTLRATQKSVCCPLNMSVTISSTVDKARTWFKGDHLLNGTVDRLNVTLVPPRKTLLKEPVRSDFEDVIYNGMNPYIKRLQAVEGKTYDVPEIKKMAEDLTLRMGEMCRLLDILEMIPFINRRVDVAVRMACILYICEGEKWTEEIEKFIATICISQLRTMANLWLDTLKKQQLKEVVINKLPVHERIWRLLPDEFTKQQLIEAEAKVTGMTPDEKKVDNKLRKWKSRSKVGRVDGEKDKWRKLLLPETEAETEEVPARA